MSGEYPQWPTLSHLFYRGLISRRLHFLSSWTFFLLFRFGPFRWKMPLVWHVGSSGSATAKPCNWERLRFLGLPTWMRVFEVGAPTMLGVLLVSLQKPPKRGSLQRRTQPFGTPSQFMSTCPVSLARAGLSGSGELCP